MSEKLNELKKATMASYLAKAGARVRSGTKIGLDFEHDAYKDMATANKHHPNMVTPGFEKDPAKLAKAEKSMKTNFDLANTFKRDAANRIKGIARAGRLLAKEDAEQIDELKKSTVASYLSKAINRHTTNMTQAGALHGAASVVAPGETLSKDELEDHLGKKAVRQMDTRPKGMNRALKQLAKEETIDEVSLVKKVKRGLAGWGAFDKDSPRELVNRNKAYDTETLKNLQTDKKTGKGSPSELQQKVINRELKKRGVAEEAIRYQQAQAALKKILKHSPNVYDPIEEAFVHVNGATSETDKHAKKHGGTPHTDTETGVIYKFGDRAKASAFKKKMGGDAHHWSKSDVDGLSEEHLDEVSRSTIAKVATARYQQAQAALKQKDFGGYVNKMKKAIKASDATTPKTGWSPEDDNVVKREEVVVPEVSAQEKYRQIRESKIRARKGK